MSDKKAPASSNQDGPQSDDHKDVPMVTEKAEPKSNFAKAAGSRTGSDKTKSKASAATKKSVTKKGHGWLWFWLLVIALIALALAAWYFIPTVRTQVNAHLQDLPLIGRHFSTVNPAGVQRSNSTANTATNPKAISDTAPTNGNSETSRDNTGLPDAATTADRTVPSDGYDSQVPTPVPQQPTGQTVEPQPSQPSATSPEPPQHQNQEQINNLRQQLATQNQTVEQLNQTIAQLQQQIAGLQRNVTAQGNRLSQLGNASREDWQLAEADYLLRLANQRLMLEQDSRAALGLLQEVDKIIRNVDMPDLYGVRQQIARDITALKLVETVDREGLYLRLRALEEQMVKLNIQPQFDLAKRDAATAQDQADNADVGEAHFRSSWQNFVSFIKESVRIRDGEVDPVLLSPQSETRFRQSLRLNMEQAELAVLRADDTVYKDAINHARQLLLDYGVENQQRQVILRELDALGQEKIQTELPDLSASQSALRNFIDKMHKVSSGQTNDDDNGGSNW
ncbi:uroporphyrinogen-III C-methyltransferase [Microbulbifer sp. HZ11]|uniref:uroporphyrinogen-III C-methyltransferase n=1 Tax=Microbulbifer sp. HZ11 TaxID=1453501 RepID=UPI0005BC105F|nr:uroporphyrinogen-III C-methyltransferase [Microbulbifer sp. HZ11]